MPHVQFAWFFMHFVRNHYNLSRRTYLPTTHTFWTTGHFVTVYKSDTCTISQAEYCVNPNFITFPTNSCNNLSLWTVAFYKFRWSFFIGSEIYVLFFRVIREKKLHWDITLDYTRVTFSWCTEIKIIWHNICSGGIISRFDYQVDLLNGRRKSHNCSHQMSLMMQLRFTSVYFLQLRTITELWDF